MPTANEIIERRKKALETGESTSYVPPKARTIEDVLYDRGYRSPESLQTVADAQEKSVTPAGISKPSYSDKLETQRLKTAATRTPEVKPATTGMPSKAQEYETRVNYNPVPTTVPQMSYADFKKQEYVNIPSIVAGKKPVTHERAKIRPAVIGNKNVTDNQPSWGKTIGSSLLGGVAQTQSSMFNIPRKVIEGVSIGLDKALPKFIYSKEMQESDPVKRALDKAVKSNEERAIQYQKDLDGARGLKNFVATGLNSLPQIVMAAVGGVAAQGNSTLASLPEAARQLIPFGTLAAGGYAKEAENEGATYGQQVAYGLLGGTAEAATEVIPLGNALELMKKFGAGEVAEKGAKTLIGKYGKTALKIIGNLLEEGIQEGIMSPLSNTAKKITYKPEMPLTGEGGIIDLKAIGKDAYSGIAMGVILGGLGLPASYASYKMATSKLESKEPITPKFIEKEMMPALAKDTAAIENEATQTAKIQQAPAEFNWALNQIIAGKNIPTALEAKYPVLIEFRNNLETERAKPQEIQKGVVEKESNAIAEDYNSLFDSPQVPTSEVNAEKVQTIDESKNNAANEVSENEQKPYNPEIPQIEIELIEKGDTRFDYMKPYARMTNEELINLIKLKYPEQDLSRHSTFEDYVETLNSLDEIAKVEQRRKEPEKTVIDTEIGRAVAEAFKRKNAGEENPLVEINTSKPEFKRASYKGENYIVLKTDKSMHKGRYDLSLIVPEGEKAFSNGSNFVDAEGNELPYVSVKDLAPLENAPQELLTEEKSKEVETIVEGDKQAQKVGKAELENDKNTISVDRTASGKGIFTAKRGDYVDVSFGNGKNERMKIIGISQSKGQVRVAGENYKEGDGIWVDKGFIYPEYSLTEKPAEKKEEGPAKSDTFSNIVDDVNKKNRPKGGFSEADKVADVEAPKSTEKTEEIKSESSAPTNAYDRAANFLTNIGRGKTMTVDKVKQEAQHIVDSGEAIKVELRKMKNDDLNKKLSYSQRGRYTKKDEMVKTIYENMLSNAYYGLSGQTTLSYTFGSGNYLDMLKDTVRDSIEKLTPELLEKNLADYKNDYEERAAKYKERVEGLKNPKTLEDFLAKKRVSGLTAEEQDKYEDLLARQRKTKRQEEKSRDAERKAARASKAIGSTDKFTITKDKHSKTGEDIWVVKLNERLETEEWKALNDSMKSLGGNWWRGNQGWNFKNDPTEKLQGDISKELETKAEAKQESKVAKLREVADNMQDSIDDMNRPRLANTAKRAREAASMEESASAAERLQQTLRNIADAIEKGEVELIDQIDSRAQVETLNSILNVAKHNHALTLQAEYRKENPNDSYKSSEIYNEIMNKPISEEDIRYAEMPVEEMYAETLKDIARNIANKKGFLQIAVRLQKAVTKAKDRKVTITDQLREDLDKIIKEPSISISNWMEEFMGQRKRLERMGIESTEELKAYLREYLKYRTKKAEVDAKQQAIREKERELIGTKIPGYFPTPNSIVAQMLELADIQEGDKVLEPSAGKGNIADMIKEQYPDNSLDVVEYNGTLSELLKEKGHNVVGDDFLEYTGEYDKIVMNPPFEKGQDMRHVTHAFELLKPGGKIVAIMSPHFTFAQDKQSKEFRDFLEENGGTFEKLPEGSFKTAERPTGVNTVMVIIEKPTEVKTEAKEEPKQEPKTYLKGKTTTVSTSDGDKIEVEYAVVSENDLIASHDTLLNTNKEYPSEMQPRQRERQSSVMQINNIMNNLNPALLGENPLASDGAPIVGNDLVVESGNGRVIALKKMYETNNTNTDAYTKWLENNRDNFGIKGELPDNPILVRVRKTDVDRAAFAKKANEVSVASMSYSEQARSDAEKFKDETALKFIQSDDGRINTAGNQDFIASFVKDSVPQNEIARVVTKDGMLSQEGLIRIKNALFFKAYNDISLIDIFSESLDNSIKNITNFMLNIAPKMIYLKSQIKAENLYNLDFSNDIAEAAKKFKALKEKGQSVENYLSQLSMFGEEDAIVAELLNVLEKNNRSAKKLTTIFNYVADAIIAAGNPNQVSMFDNEVPTKADILEYATGRFNNEQSGQAEGQLTIFEIEPGDSVEDSKSSRKDGRRTERKKPKGGVQSSAMTGDIDPFKGKPSNTVGIVAPGTRISRPKRNAQDQYVPGDQAMYESYQENRGLPKKTALYKTREAIAGVYHMATRTFEHLPSTKQFAEAIKEFVFYPKIKRTASDEIVRTLEDITGNLSQYEYDVFNWKVMLDDFAEELRLVHELPFGWTEAQVANELQRIESELSPAVKEALNKRRKYWDKINSNYIKSAKAHGFDVSNRLTKENYYRHQVIEKTNEKNVRGPGKKMKVNTGRGYLKQRQGSQLAINTNYLEAEYEVMAQMLIDTMTNDMLSRIKKEYDIRPKLEKMAKNHNESAFQDLVDNDKALNGEPSAIEEIVKGFRKKMGMSMSELADMAYNGTLWKGENGEYSKIVDDIAAGEKNDELFKYLAALLESGEDGSMQAATFLKAVSEKRVYIDDLLKASNLYRTWENFVPKGHEKFQPREGNAFYFAESIPQKLADQLLDETADSLSINKNDLRSILAKGQRFHEIVIPTEIAATMNSMYKTQPTNVVSAASKKALNLWKRWILQVNPRKVVKYNLRNLSGDLDGLLAGAPGATAYASKAAKELHNAIKYGRFSKDLLELRDRGGYLDTLFVSEISDISSLKPFRDLDIRKDESNLAKNIKQPFKTYAEFTENLGNYREMILRYAAYLYFKNNIIKNNGKVKNYAASNRNLVEGLHTVEDKAYKLSKDLLGAYDEISQLGQLLRNHLVPFFSFQEINFKRYFNLFKNAGLSASDEKTLGNIGKSFTKRIGITTVVTGRVAVAIGAMVIKVSLLSAMLLAWNTLVMGDDDDELPEDIRNIPHLTLGRDKDGNVLYFSRLGSTTDFLDWFGLDTGIQDVLSIMDGTQTWEDFIKDMAIAPVNKIWSSLTPMFKTPVELLYGSTMYPDIRKPSSIRDKGEYAARSLGLENEYKQVAGLPSKPYGESLQDIVIYKNDPKQSNYYKALDLKNRFEEKVQGKSPTFTMSKSDKSEALYYFKTAIRLKDKEAAKKYIFEYFEKGGNSRGLNQSLNYLNPVYGITASEKDSYKKWLKENDSLDIVNKAVEYYNRELNIGNADIKTMYSIYADKHLDDKRKEKLISDKVDKIIK